MGIAFLFLFYAFLEDKALPNGDLPELQIRGGIKDNSKIISLISHEHICCDPSLEPSQ